GRVADRGVVGVGRTVRDRGAAPRVTVVGGRQSGCARGGDGDGGRDPPRRNFDVPAVVRGAAQDGGRAARGGRPDVAPSPPPGRQVPGLPPVGRDFHAGDHSAACVR